MVKNEKDSAALDHIESAIQDSHELQSILKLFEKYPELEEIRKRELAIDAEDCYGPWLGGKYYWVALGKVLEQWRAEKKSETQEYTQGLQQQVDELKKENQKLRKANQWISDYVLDFFMKAGRNPSFLGESFENNFRVWVQMRAEAFRKDEEGQGT